MLTTLRILTAALVIFALALFVSSFAPVTLPDFARFTIRVCGFASLAIAYVAFEARVFVGRR